MCRYCDNDLSFSNIEIVHDHLPAISSLPEPPPPLPLSKPALSSESCRRPTPRWMEKLPSNRVSKHSAPRIPKPLIPHIIEPSTPPPSIIHKHLAPPRDPKLVASTPIPPPSSSPSPSTTTTPTTATATTTTITTILLPPDSNTNNNTTTTTTTSSSSSSSSSSSLPNATTVVVAELRTPIRSSSIRKTYAKAAALTRTDAQRRRRRTRMKLNSRSSPYVAKDLSALFSAVGRGGLA